MDDWAGSHSEQQRAVITPMKSCLVMLILLCVWSSGSIAQPSGGESEGNAQGCADGAGVGPGHVGGGLDKGVSRPKPTYTPEPGYSDEARHAQLRGVVVLWVCVDKDGAPHGIRVARSLGMGLDEAAIAAVQQWKFEPASSHSETVATHITVECEFSPKSSRCSYGP